MTDIKIKQNLHTLIDNLQDVRILKLVHEAVCEDQLKQASNNLTKVKK